MPNSFKDEVEIRSLVRAFEGCEFNPADFKHHQHLAVALWYVAHFPFEEASDQMRNGIQKLAAAYGKTGYHETITIFWLRMVRDFFVTAAANESISAVTNRLIARFGDKESISDYYSRELLGSEIAKSEWVEPDLKPLPARI